MPETTEFADGTFALGCNYWASNAGIYMWRQFDADAVKRDFDRLREYGLTVLRIFPLWPDFQPVIALRGPCGRLLEMRRAGDIPLEGDECARNGLDPVMLERFNQVLDLARERGFRVVVALLTGWMSGRMFVPPALENCNLLNDPVALEWECRFIRAFVRYFAGHPAVAAWEPGNECNCMAAVADSHSAWTWMATVTATVRAADPTRPVWSGMHGLSADSTAVWQIAGQGELCDMLTTHPYPCHFTPYAELDRVDAIRNVFHGVAEARLYGDCGGRPACIEEAGSLGKMFSAPEIAAAYLRNMLWNAWAHDCRALLWWCSSDYNHLDYPPYDWNAMERELGLLDSAMRPTPQLEAMKQFRDTLAVLNLDPLPVFRKNAVVVLSGGQDQWGVAWASWLLAKQAGFDIEFQYASTPLKPSGFYILPSIASTAAMPRRHYRELLDAVERGATVLATWHGGALEPFETVFGVRVLRRYTADSPARLRLGSGGTEFPVSQPMRLELENIAAEVLGTDENHMPVWTQARYGRGRALFLGCGMEAELIRQPGAFAPGGAPWYEIYRRAAAVAGVERVVSSPGPWITLTEHEVAPDTVVAIAVNHTCDTRKFAPVAAPGWTVAEYRYGTPGTIGNNDAVVLLLRKS